MESLNQKIENFLKIEFYHRSGIGDRFGIGSGSGRGYGFYGNGSGDGDGYGDSIGTGDGSGIGSGYGAGGFNGNGYGSGIGSGAGGMVNSGYGCGSGAGYSFDWCYNILEYNKHKVYHIDSIPTIITSVKGNIARGYIIKSNLTIKDVYIAKKGEYFAHGASVKEAVNDVDAKYNMHLSEEERVNMFLSNFKTELQNNAPISAKKLFQAHGSLTGSCYLGRKIFCENKNINLETDFFTIDQFIELTIDAYNSSVIQKLKEKLKQ